MDTRILTRQELDPDIREVVPTGVKQVVFQDYTPCSMGDRLLGEVLGKGLVVPPGSIFLIRPNSGDSLVLGQRERIMNRIPSEIDVQNVVHIEPEQERVSLFKGESMIKLLQGGI